jgi:hypothetical protein
MSWFRSQCDYVVSMVGVNRGERTIARNAVGLISTTPVSWRR